MTMESFYGWNWTSPIKYTFVMRHDKTLNGG